MLRAEGKTEGKTKTEIAFIDAPKVGLGLGLELELGPALLAPFFLPPPILTFLPSRIHYLDLTNIQVPNLLTLGTNSFDTITYLPNPLTSSTKLYNPKYQCQC